MQFPLKAAALVLMATSFTIASVSQVDPCDPGGARYGTKDCTGDKKTTVRKTVESKKTSAVPKSSSASAASAKPGSSTHNAAQKSKEKSAAKKAPAKQDSAAKDK